MMQMLASERTRGERPAGPSRDYITKEAALDAVLLVFAEVDERLQAGELDPERATHVMTMLVAIREYIEPLPEPPGDEALLASDLEEIRTLLERADADWRT